MAQPSKFDAKERIQRTLDEIPALKQIGHGSQEFSKWRRNSRLAIEYTFGNDSSHAEEFNAIRYTPFLITESALEIAYQSGLKRATALLESMIEEIEEYWADEEPMSSSHQLECSVEIENTAEHLTSKRIFVVHGRDEGTRHMVVRFLERLDLEPIVLMEQSNEGRTIIEKFEEYADVGFAVVLCTPDDVGALETEKDNLRHRPRQNVVLEWGFFMGKIGRDRVCALVKDDVEIPSDYAGVLHIPLDDSEGWQMKLLTELKSAGLPVDANRLFTP